MISVKDDMFGYVAASPDKSYLIAVGLRYELSWTVSHNLWLIEFRPTDLLWKTFRQGKTTKIFHRWVVKIDANTGATIWEFSMPSSDARVGKHSGYESVVFTEDGGFIAAGFAQGLVQLSHSEI